VIALGPGEIRARRRPLVIAGIACLRLLVGFCLAWPLSSLISDSGIGQRSEGDRALFESGGYLLLEVVRLRGSELMAVGRGLVPLLVLGLILTAACNAALLVALNLKGRLDRAAWLSRAFGRLPAILLLGLGTGLGQLVLIVAGVIAVGAIPDSLARPVATSAAQLAVWLVVALAAGALGGVADVAKASLVRHDSRLVDGLARAWLCLRQRPIRASFGWFPYALGFGLAVFLAAELCQLLDVSRPGAWRVASVFALHQLVILASVAARAGWFARALRLTATEV
jgi:hypothetical protein